MGGTLSITKGLNSFRTTFVKSDQNLRQFGELPKRKDVMFKLDSETS